MQQHIYYIKFALQFADKQISELVTVFNAQVQRRAWTSMRAYHDQALILVQPRLPTWRLKMFTNSVICMSANCRANLM